MIPSKFRKKPVTIEAMQWKEEVHDLDIIEWIEGNGGFAYRDPDLAGLTSPSGEDWGSFQVSTLEGDMDIAPLAWIIRGVQGEFYPCRDDIFAVTYEAVSDV